MMLKKFYNFINERFDINNLPNKNILLSKDLSDKGGILLIYDIGLKKPIGYISFGFHKGINSFTVGGAYSKNGYGAFLYECAMTYVYPNGLSMCRDATTSEDALEVWRKFEKRNDIKKERIYSDEITHKKDDWLNSGFLDDDTEYRQTIFDLEDTRFYYNFDKAKLTKLIHNGKHYMKNNDISDKDIEYMTYDLE